MNQFCPAPIARLLLSLALCLLAATPAAAKRKKIVTLQRPADAVEVFTCDFTDNDWDVNYDLWPDGWKRIEGPEYPHYVEIEIGDSRETQSGRCLSIRLDGAQARISTPLIRVLPKFSYFLELKANVHKVAHSRVYVQLDYLNRFGKVRHSARQHLQMDKKGWQTVSIKASTIGSRDVDRAVIRIVTEKGERGDLDGEVSIGDIWLGRLPNMQLVANNEFHVYSDPKDVMIRCTLSGISERDPKILFQLLDATNRELGETGVKKLDGTEIIGTEQNLIQEESFNASDIVDAVGNQRMGYEGSENWHPNIEQNGGYGFFQVRAKMISSETGKLMDKRELTLAVIPPSDHSAQGEFGWTLPRADAPLRFEALESVLPLAGVSWVKFPIWFTPTNPARGDQILQFAERIAANDIETIGILQSPELDDDVELTEEERDLIPVGDVAEVFGRDPSRWGPMFDTIMTRMSLRVRLWQLGADSDTTLVGYPKLVEQVSRIRQQLFRFGQDVRVGLPWRWDTPQPEGPVSWDYGQFYSDPPLSADELDAHLNSLPKAGAEQWVSINPVDENTLTGDPQTRHQNRVREFIRQIVAAKKHSAKGIFVSNPFSGSHGLMTEEGKPGELLLPWRTASSLLGGASFLGHLTLPGGSDNWLFLRGDGQVVMVVWSDEPSTEELYLGDSIEQLDVWGKRVKTSRNGSRDVVSVGVMPTFVIGVNEAVARLRMAIEFEKTRLPSVFGQTHTNALLFKNDFPQGIGGKVTLFVPDRLRSEFSGEEVASAPWNINFPTERFVAAAGEAVRLPVEIELDDAAFGEQPIRIDFTIDSEEAGETRQFSIWRTLTVGLGDVSIEVSTMIDENGRMIVRQEMKNFASRPLNFKCYLYAPGRRRKRAQVFELGEQVDTKTYTYPNGEQLLGGDFKLRVEEIDGERVLIHRFIGNR